MWIFISHEKQLKWPRLHVIRYSHTGSSWFDDAAKIYQKFAGQGKKKKLYRCASAARTASVAKAIARGANVAPVASAVAQTSQVVAAFALAATTTTVLAADGDSGSLCAKSGMKNEKGKKGDGRDVDAGIGRVAEAAAGAELQVLSPSRLSMNAVPRKRRTIAVAAAATVEVFLQLRLSLSCHLV